MNLQFMSSVILVKDVKISRHFYEELLGQKVLVDHGVCVGYCGGFSIWEEEYARNVMRINHTGNTRDHSMELYFESDDLDDVQKMVLENKLEFVHEMIEQPWCQRCLRVYDPDRYIVEIGEPMPIVIKRLLAGGLNLEEIAAKTYMPLDMIKKMAEV